MRVALTRKLEVHSFNNPIQLDSLKILTFLMKCVAAGNNRYYHYREHSVGTQFITIVL